MATYVVHADRADAVPDGDAASFKYRYRSTEGHATAQDEFDRRRRAGQRVVLTRWALGQPEVVARWDDLTV